MMMIVIMMMNVMIKIKITRILPIFKLGAPDFGLYLRNDHNDDDDDDDQNGHTLANY